MLSLTTLPNDNWVCARGRSTLQKTVLKLFQRPGSHVCAEVRGKYSIVLGHGSGVFFPLEESTAKVALAEALLLRCQSQESRYVVLTIEVPSENLCSSLMPKQSGCDCIVSGNQADRASSLQTVLQCQSHKPDRPSMFTAPLFI